MRLFLQRLGLKQYLRPRSLWEADHIMPVVEGGGGCGLDNIRTLCVPCHRRETAALAARRAAARRDAKQPSLPGAAL
jgi:5-methylcytosine-specific restriction endonuclease McrA